MRPASSPVEDVSSVPVDLGAEPPKSLTARAAGAPGSTSPPVLDAMTEAAGERTHAVDRVVRLFGDRWQMLGTGPSRPPQPAGPGRRFREPLLSARDAELVHVATGARQLGTRPDCGDCAGGPDRGDRATRGTRGDCGDQKVQ